MPSTTNILLSYRAHDFALEAAIGRQWVEDNSAFGFPDYNTWKLGIAYTWQGFTGRLQYIDTTISKDVCPDGCDATLVASVTREL